jgi:hypothetical protein
MIAKEKGVLVDSLQERGQARGRFHGGETETLTRKAVEQHLLFMRDASPRREGRVRPA